MNKKFISSFIVAGLLATNIPVTSYANDFTNLNTSENTSIDYFNDNEFIEETILTLADEIRTKKNNGATDEELNSFVETQLLKQRYDLNGYITGVLNSKEQTLYNSNKAKGLLCMANGKLAINYTDKNYSSGLHNGNADAFRHVLWNFGMVIDVGYSFAKQWSDAHEYGSNGPEIEKTMDLYNNSIGLQLGKSYPNTILHSTFVNKTKEKVRNGSCKRIVNNKLVSTNSSGEK